MHNQSGYLVLPITGKELRLITLYLVDVICRLLLHREFVINTGTRLRSLITDWPTKSELPQALPNTIRCVWTRLGMGRH